MRRGILVILQLIIVRHLFLADKAVDSLFVL